MPEPTHEEIAAEINATHAALERARRWPASYSVQTARPRRFAGSRVRWDAGPRRPASMVEAGDRVRLGRIRPAGGEEIPPGFATVRAVERAYADSPYGWTLLLLDVDGLDGPASANVRNRREVEVAGEVTDEDYARYDAEQRERRALTGEALGPPARSERELRSETLRGVTVSATADDLDVRLDVEGGSVTLDPWEAAELIAALARVLADPEAEPGV